MVHHISATQDLGGYITGVCVGSFIACDLGYKTRVHAGQVVHHISATQDLGGHVTRVCVGSFASRDLGYKTKVYVGKVAHPEVCHTGSRRTQN